jgi:membrane protease YdiL (CAAX protease family)
MAGDLVSNMYEEFVYRGLIFCACYRVIAATPFPLVGPLDRWATAFAAIASSLAFALSHQQYSMGLRVFMAVMSLAVWAWPFFTARSLWAPWIPHTLADLIGDSILKL